MLQFFSFQLSSLCSLSVCQFNQLAGPVSYARSFSRTGGAVTTYKKKVGGGGDTTTTNTVQVQVPILWMYPQKQCFISCPLAMNRSSLFCPHEGLFSPVPSDGAPFYCINSVRQIALVVIHCSIFPEENS